MKNKNIFKALMAASVLMFSTTACDDKLDLSPFDSVESGDAFQTPSDFTNGIRGVYSGLRNGSYWGGWMVSMPDILADNLIISSEGRFSKDDYFFWQYNPNIAWLGLWNNAYDVVYRSNVILENIDKLSDGDFKNNIEAQALALRAMAHFDLARVYAESPAVASGSELGIPYVTTTDVLALPSRPSLNDTYTQILADLNAAAGKIAETNPTGQLDEAGVYALLSRVYLFMGDNANTITAATKAINAGSGTVASRADFPGVWTDANNAGVIFELPILDVDNISVGVEFSQTGNTGVRSEYVADFDFYNMFQDTDVRQDVYHVISEFADQDQIHIEKYMGRASGNANVVDIKILRWEEVYLNRAEAYAAQDQDALALADLNMIRMNRYAGFDPDDALNQESGDNLDDAIALERRLELAYEADRFFTLKRKGLPVTRSAFGDVADGSGVTVPADKRVLPADSYLFVFPIPQPEINANPNMQQNPGYTN